MSEKFKLNNGKYIPSLGLGTWESPKGQVQHAVKYAIENGYRHIDCAAMYFNEQEIGNGIQSAIKSGAVSRQDLFVTSKLWNTCHRREHVRPSLLRTLKALQLDYLDLYLIHWPICLAYCGEEISEDKAIPKDENGKVKYDAVPLRETWEALEALVDEGLVKSIGLSNFNLQLISDLLSYARIIPALVQIELHPYNVQQDLVEFLQQRNIQVTAYSPLGRGSGPLKDATIQAIARKYDKTPGQVLIRWALDRNTCVIPKSVHEKRILENMDIYNFKLTNHEMNEIAKLDRGERTVIGKDIFGMNAFA